MSDNLQSLRTIVCRPALPKDTTDVLELTREIWDGHDYVPHVWAEWLADAQGVLAVAEYAGKVVGLAKLSAKGAGEWWMQGLRVHPAFQGQGVASRLHDYILNYWQRRLDGVIRLATSSARLPVHHLCERSGFSKVGEYLSYVAPALDGQVHGFVPIEEEEALLALEYALKSPMHPLSFGFMDLSWYWGELTLERIMDAIRQGHALWGLDHGGWRWALLVFDLDDDEGGLSLYSVAGLRGRTVGRRPGGISPPGGRSGLYALRLDGARSGADSDGAGESWFPVRLGEFTLFV